MLFYNKLHLFSYTLGITLFLMGCESECPEDEFYGKFELSKETKDQLLYLQFNKIYFVNKKQEEVVYQFFAFEDSSYNSQTVPIGEICSKRKSKSELFIESEYVSGKLFQESSFDLFLLDFSIFIHVKNIDQANPYDPVLVDWLIVLSYSIDPKYVSQIPNHSTFELATSSRKSSFGNEKLEDVVFYDQIELQNKQFTKVFCNRNGPKLYYNFDYGLVGFEDNHGELWVFDRYE